jgi:hypothetical protein
MNSREVDFDQEAPLRLGELDKVSADSQKRPLFQSK